MSEEPNTSEDKKPMTIGEWANLVDSAVDEEVLFRALEKAAEYGWIPEKVTVFTYMKNIERMKTILLDNTDKTLEKLEKRVSNLKRREKDNINSYHNNAIDEVLELLKDEQKNINEEKS